MQTIIIKFEVTSVDEAIQVLARNTYTLERLTRDAQGHGAKHHSFYTDGKAILAIDEWDNETAFHEFFDSNPEVQALMAQAHTTKVPDITSLTPLKVVGTF